MSSDLENYGFGRIYRPGPNIKEKLQSLRSAISDKPPYCSGTVSVAASDLTIFFRKSNEGRVDSAGIVDFTRASETNLQELVDACQVATFGLNDKDVLDLSYRKAWKLDPEYFSTKLNILHAGLMDSIRYNLLSGDQGSKPFFAELYKLNVYGKGSFFKPHKDTPRGEKMFGSLVVVLPAAHEGGTLILRHDNKEWKIESDQVEASTIAYAAFYGDVEHEVTEVKSGFRVTLTYNLYFGKPLNSQSVISTLYTTVSADLPAALPPHAPTGSFQAKLSELLADDTFLPMGGRLGFGLSREYCLKCVGDADGDASQSKPAHELQQLANVLKGNDATIMQACHALGLVCEVLVCYVDHDDFVALCDRVPHFGDEYLEESILDHLMNECQAAVTLDAPRNDDSYFQRNRDIESLAEINLDEFERYHVDFFVHWVTEMTPNNAFEANVVTYGNEPQHEGAYGHVCLIIAVGPPGCRSEDPIDV